MKEIKLTRGKVALVDDEDFEYLNQWNWHATSGRNNYAARATNKNYNHVLILMHRIIMNTPDNLYVDHVDHNSLNNQKSNLRNCTHKQNHLNKKGSGKSGYLGVYYNNNRIVSQLSINGKVVHIGYFKTEIEAAKARDLIAIKTRGEFANLNFR